MSTELTMQLSPEQLCKLERLASQRGITADELAAELVRKHVEERTKPKAPKGNIRPFRRP
jgi:hypothetical protein